MNNLNCIWFFKEDATVSFENYYLITEKKHYFSALVGSSTTSCADKGLFQSVFKLNYNAKWHLQSLSRNLYFCFKKSMSK